MKSDPKSLTINTIGILFWIFLWFYYVKNIIKSSEPLHMVFYILLGILVFNLLNSDSEEGSYEEEIRKLNHVENHAKTLCTLIITVSLCTRMMNKSLSQPIQNTFYQLMILSIISASFVLFDYSISKDAARVREIRKVESILINYSTAFLVMSVVFVSFRMIRK